MAINGIERENLGDDFLIDFDSHETALKQLIKTKHNIQDFINGIGQRNIIWAIYGDSMASSKSQFILPHFQNILGYAGTIGQGNYLGVTNNSGNLGTVQDYSIYPFTMGKIDTGNSYAYGIFGGNAIADVWKIYYINNGASFKVQIDGIDNITINTLNDNTIDVVTITTTLASHSINIVNLAGTVFLPCFGMYNSTVSGIIPIYTNEGGNDMIDWIHNDLALDNLAFIYSDMGVNLWSYEMKENVTDLHSRVVKLFDKINVAIPDADKLIFSTTPIVNDINNTQVINNEITKEEAIKRNYNYFDCFKKVVSYEILVANNWENDGIHPNEDCQKWLSNEFLNDFNLISFGVGQSPIGIYYDLKSKKFTSGNLEMYEEPIYKYDGVIKAYRFVEFKNKTGSRSFIIDLGDGTNTSDGSQSILPYRFRMGAGGCILEGLQDQNILNIRTTDSTDYADLYLSKIKQKGFTTAEINALYSPPDGLEVYNSTLGLKCQYSAAIGGWIKYSYSLM